MKYTLKICSALLATAALFSFATITEPPKDWFAAGSQPKSYEMKMDKSVFKTGSSSATIQSIDKRIRGFGTLMQSCAAKNYLNKKIKLSAYIKTSNVKKWAGLWLRVDGSKPGERLGFDNMQDRRITGTKGWTLYEVILDVPSNAESMHYGVLISGKGKLWFDDVKIEVIGVLENTRKEPISEGYKEQPMNLDFEQ